MTTPTEPSTPDKPFLIREAAPILADMLTHSVLLSADSLPLEVGAEVDTPFGKYGLSMKLAELPEARRARLTLQAERAAQEIERHGKALDDTRGRLRRWLGR